MRRNELFTVVVLGAVATVFGVIDAVLWERPSTYWIANMSSAYLALAFAAGRLLPGRSGRAALSVAAGWTVTVVALGAFYLWQIRIAHTAPVLAESELRRYVLGGVVTGPVFGWLGHQWGVHRSWYAGGAVVGALLLEPYAWRKHLGFAPSPSWIWHAEQSTGVALGVFFIVQGVRHLSRPPVVPTS